MVLFATPEIVVLSVAEYRRVRERAAALDRERAARAEAETKTAGWMSQYLEMSERAAEAEAHLDDWKAAWLSADNRATDLAAQLAAAQRESAALREKADVVVRLWYGNNMRALSRSAAQVITQAFAALDDALRAAPPPSTPETRHEP